MTDIVNLESHYIGSPTPGVNLYQLPNASMQVLQDIINAVWAQGITNKEEFAAKITAAVAGFLNVTAAPHVTAGTISVPTVAGPDVTIPSSVNVDDIINKYTTEYLALATWLDGKFTAFRATYFPDESAAYTAAENWLQEAIANPDAGIPPSIIAQIVGDDEARILADASRAADSVVAQFAARRFPLPPDAAASAVLQIKQKAQDEIAESSRKISAMSIDMQKFNVEKLLGLRDSAMQAAINYVKALASGPEITSRMVNVGYDAQSKLISAASDFFRADIASAEMTSKVQQYNNSLTLDAAVKNQASDLQMIDNKLRALLEECKSIAQFTTAMFNNLHVSASLQANGGTTVSQSGEL